MGKESRSVSLRAAVCCCLSCLVIAAVVVVGSAVPLPGLDPVFVDRMIWSGGVERVSILLLGTGPILTGLALGQLMLLAVPRLADRYSFTVVVRLAVLVIGLMQALGVAQAMGAFAPVGRDGAAFHWLIVATMLGGCALTLFLSEQMRLPLLTVGFWLLWLLPALRALPEQGAAAFALVRSGTGSLGEIVLALAFVVGGLSLCLYAGGLVLNKARRLDLQAGRTRVDVLSMVVWPPLLAAIVAGYLLVPVVMLIPDTADVATGLTDLIFAATMLLTPVFVVFYSRRFARQGVAIVNGTMLLVVAALWHAMRDSLSGSSDRA